jgi:hypothetical protein
MHTTHDIVINPVIALRRERLQDVRTMSNAGETQARLHSPSLWNICHNHIDRVFTTRTTQHMRLTQRPLSRCPHLVLNEFPG